MSGINFKLAEQSDIQNIADLHANSWRENYRGSVSDEYLSEHVDQDRLTVWSKRLVDPPANQWVMTAYSDHRLIGFICLYGNHHPEFGTIIDNLHVSAQSKGLGLGTQLLKQAAEWAELKHTARHLYLEVLANNQKAIGFYESLGGRQIGEAVWSAPCGSKVQEWLFQWTTPAQLLSATTRLK